VIATVLEERCIGCGKCVEVCPTDVLVSTARGVPTIAHVDDCQTCFACELYCPVDALYVDADCDVPRSVTAEEALNSPSLGQYRRHAGWGDNPEENPNEFWRMELMFLAVRGIPVSSESEKR
jgi:NAD-dependent dihydropyrimidine dehydrogenase PreA subunit